jgi:hypothetical protein
MFQKISATITEKNLVIYKLLHDSLFVFLLFFVLALIAEGALPGVIASHFGLYKIAVLILLNILAITSIGRFFKITEKNISHKKIAGSLFFLSALLIFNGLIKLPLILSLFILITVFAIFYFLFKVFQEKE